MLALLLLFVYVALIRCQVGECYGICICMFDDLRGGYTVFRTFVYNVHGLLFLVEMPLLLIEMVLTALSVQLGKYASCWRTCPSVAY